MRFFRRGHHMEKRKWIGLIMCEASLSSEAAKQSSCPRCLQHQDSRTTTSFYQPLKVEHGSISQQGLLIEVS